MSKSKKRRTPGSGIKRDERKEAERSLRRKIKNHIQNGSFVDLPDRTYIGKDENYDR